VRMLYGSKSTDDILLRCGINQQLCFRYPLSHASATHSRMLPLLTLACFRYPLSHASATHSRMLPLPTLACTRPGATSPIHPLGHAFHLFTRSTAHNPYTVGIAEHNTASGAGTR
jgi:hypothetical protein